MWLRITIFVSFFLVLGCTGNVLREMADKNSDDALLFDAKTAVNAQAYDEAINILTVRLSASGQQKNEARAVLASAYAGKCGLNFIEFVDGLAAATTGTAFTMISSPFVGIVVDSPYCLQSLQTLELIGPTETRTVDQNAFASIVGMVLMGASTRLYTDDNPINGDGVQDAVDISCTLTDPQIDNVILGYGYMAKNFDALSTDQIGTGAGTAISDSINTCTAIAGSSCEITEPAAITLQMRNTMRDLMNTLQYGVGVAAPLLITDACP